MRSKINLVSLYSRSNPLSLEVINIPPASGQSPVGLVVVLHGWGANALDLASVVPVLNLPDFQFICPNAPFSHPRMSTGKAWYNLERQDYKGLTESRQLLKDWLKSLESTTGVPLSRTILCGFSQGAAMTLDVGLTLPLAGLICLSGYLHPNPQLADKTSMPVLIYTWRARLCGASAFCSASARHFNGFRIAGTVSRIRHGA